MTDDPMAAAGAGLAQPKAGVRAKVVSEFRAFVVIAIYLWICFTAVAYLKATILEAQGIAFAPFGFAAAKALIFAKFILFGRALRLGERFRTLPLFWPVLYKSLAFLVLLTALNFVEEICLGFLHHRTIQEVVAGIGGGALDQMLATSIVLLLILVPFFAFEMLDEMFADRNLVQVFFIRRSARPDGGQA